MNLNNPDTAARQLARAVAILALAGFFLLPLSASADSTYFCSAAATQGGNGSATSPWTCADDEQLEAILNTVCTNGGGTLYRSLGDSFITYDVMPAADGGCSVTSETTPGQPPTAGGDSLPRPLLLAAGLVGALALIVGLLLRVRPARS